LREVVKMKISGEILFNGNTGCYHIIENCRNFNITEILNNFRNKEKTICIVNGTKDILLKRCGEIKMRTVKDINDYYIDEKNISDILWINLNKKIILDII
jgi:hypothetical protein